MRAFVLSGGAALGSVQVGMMQALWERGITPDLVIGASAGAINAAFIAGAPTADALGDLDRLWCELRRGRVFPTRPLLGLTGFLGKTTHLVPNGGLRSILRANLPVEDLEDSAIPVKVVATNLLSGVDHALSSGNAVEAVLASAAIPGVFAPVEIGDEIYIDGGIANNTPISHAIAGGADEVWVLPAGYACALAQPPSSALAVAVQALGLLVHSRLVHDFDRYGSMVDMRVVPPLCPLAIGPTDFGKARQLIDDARRSTTQWLASPMPKRPELHHHKPAQRR